jgi:hypothetical protein
MQTLARTSPMTGDFEPPANLSQFGDRWVPYSPVPPVSEPVDLDNPRHAAHTRSPPTRLAASKDAREITRS